MCVIYRIENIQMMENLKGCEIGDGICVGLLGPIVFFFLGPLLDYWVEKVIF